MQIEVVVASGLRRRFAIGWGASTPIGPARKQLPDVGGRAVIPGAMDDLTVTGNLVEAVLWLGFAATFARLALRASGRKRRLWLILTAAFLVFGASDVIESRTGAWWRPWWLLIMKTACIAVFFYAVREYPRLAKSADVPKPGSPADGAAVKPGARQE